MYYPKKAINFLSKDEFEKNPIGKALKWALSVGRIIIIVTEFITIAVFFSRFKLDNDLNNLNEEIAQKQVVISSFSQLENNVRFLQERLEAINQVELTSINLNLAFDELEKIIPLDVTFSEVKLNNNSLSITAESLSPSGLATFLNGLKSSQQFTQINLISVVSEGVNSSLLKFQLSALFKPQPL